MLPLWIIDLNSDAYRCQLFQQHLRAISGAMLAVSNIPAHLLTADIPNDTESVDDPLEENGQWYYSHFDNPFADADFTNEEGMADLLYGFKEYLVTEGQNFVSYLRRSKVSTDISINICVLGHIEEQMTQMTFASIASLLQLEKGRILPQHIHQGVNIMGMLYIPSAVNTRKREDRQRVLRCLREVEVQREVSSLHGYDKMMYYQDVQNKTQKVYPRLNLTQQVDYVTQCIINLFYATNNYHPLLDGSSSNEHFYFSMGPASIFYDPTLQDLKDQVSVANGVIASFKAEGLGKRIDKVNFVNEKEYDTTKTLCDIFSKVNLDLDKVEPKEPDPHPIRDFLYKPLKRRYYEGYLARFPSLLMSKITTMVADQTRETLEAISLSSKEKLNNFVDVAVPQAVRQLLVDCNQNTGAIFRVERQFGVLKEKLAQKEKQIDDEMEYTVWNKIQERVAPELSDHFLEYHDEYREDADNIRHHKGSTADRCDSRKKEALNDLVNHIRREPTVLSRFARVFLFGIVLVLLLLPVLEILSPAFINLGNVARNAFFWAVGVFLLPTLWQLVSYIIYKRRLRFYLTRLKAFYLHDAYARVVNAIRSEAEFFYTKALVLCDEYLKRCEQIRNEVKPLVVEQCQWQPDIPQTTFNQPLVDGEFGGKHLFPGEFVDHSKVLVSQKSEFVNKLQLEDYFSLIRVLKDQMNQLFSNVKLPNTHERKVDEATGRMVFLSIAEMNELKTSRWNQTLETFRKDLTDNIKRLMVPRRLDTVDSKVLNYADVNENVNIMKPFLDFCATNGELTSDNCREFADVKCNDEKMKNLVMNDLPFNTIYQFDKHEVLYKKFFFLTKWRTYDHIAANRILPEVDLDLSLNDAHLLDDDDAETAKPCVLPYSSVLLYALCGDDATASIWLKLFRNREFAELAEKTRFLEKMKSESRVLNKTLNKLD